MSDETHLYVTSGWRRALAALLPPGRPETPVRFVLRVATGLVFLATGQMKLVGSIVLGTSLVHLTPGIKGFAEYLEAVGISFPLAGAYVVTGVELVGAALLVSGAFWPRAIRWTRVVCLALAVDMLVALAKVGLQNLADHPVILHGVPVTFQPWRLPLEASLLLCMLLFARFPSPPDVAGNHLRSSGTADGRGRDPVPALPSLALRQPICTSGSNSVPVRPAIAVASSRREPQ